MTTYEGLIKKYFDLTKEYNRRLEEEGRDSADQLNAERVVVVKEIQKFLHVPVTDDRKTGGGYNVIVELLKYVKEPE